MKRTRYGDVIDRLYNCKFEGAFEELKKIKGSPKKTIDAFKKASEELGNCGWGGSLIDKTATRLAKLIGYTYNEKKEYFVYTHGVNKNEKN